MARYKDLPKIHAATTDGYALEHSVKGSLAGGPILAEQAIIERREEDSYSKAIEEVQWQLQDIKKDIKKIKDIVDAMDRNGLKMKTQW